MEIKKIRFDTKVQLLKYKALKEVATFAWKGELLEHITDIPKIIIPGKIPTMRCCVYKERAIISERVKLAMGGDKNNPNVIEVIDIACDDCPMDGYTVTSSCRSCLAHNCKNACPKGAISFDEQQRPHIDKSICVNCGLCAAACPFNAINNLKRPCVSACKVKAISYNDDMSCKIDNDKCIACGACVYQCPFGAINDKSYILEVIDIIKNSDNNRNYNTVAIIAPAISSQFTYAKFGQILTAIKKLGFNQITEAALGADMVAVNEAKEFAEKGFMTSSCCPAFVTYIEKNYPNLAQYVSSSFSPAVTIAKFIKEKDPTCKTVFIGPCTAKKAELKKPETSKYVDSVITFEELQALFDSKNILAYELEETDINEASTYGRAFAMSCGVSKAVIESAKEQGLNVEINPLSCNGIAECKMALAKKENNILKENFIEGMACVGGCIGGAGCINHNVKNKTAIEQYSNLSESKTILESLEKNKKEN